MDYLMYATSSIAEIDALQNTSPPSPWPLGMHLLRTMDETLANCFVHDHLSH